MNIIYDGRIPDKLLNNMIIYQDIGTSTTVSHKMKDVAMNILHLYD